MRIDVQIMSMTLLLLFLTAGTSALYFPQSNLSIRLPPFSQKDGGALRLLALRALRDDSTDSGNPKYDVISSDDKLLTGITSEGNLVLRNFPKHPGGAKTIVVKARENTNKAFLEIKLQPLSEQGKINCMNYIQDICFWNSSVYKIYENQPVTLLGTIKPSIYEHICPDFRISRYELLNGTDYFYLNESELYSNALLDRDTLGPPPKGPGGHVRLSVKCVLWEKTTGVQYVLKSAINVEILDENDNPPLTQTDKEVEIHLSDFTVGARLDAQQLLFQDADEITTNRYTVRILNDIHNAFNITHVTYPIELSDRVNNPPSTAVVTRIYAKTTLLPKSPYRVILQVKDETLLPGYGENSVNVTLSFNGPQHRTTSSTTTSVPLKRPVLFPSSVVRIPRMASQYFRVSQPSQDYGHFGVVFGLQGSKAFNVTRHAGIIYVGNATLLKSSPSVIPLTIHWKSAAGGSQSSVTLTVELLDDFPDDSCPRNNETSAHSCANAESKKDCESSCGIGSGFFTKDKSYRRGCTWRVNNANGGSNAIMTENYETCSPNLIHCPDHVCDELEILDYRICPQDCTIESEAHFAEMNEDGRGIKIGLGTCFCNDMMQCTCGPGAIGEGNHGEGGGSRGNKENKDRDRERNEIVSGARKASSSPCGPTCLIGVIGASLFVLVVIVGSFVMWRYRTASKGSRRECKHRVDDGTNPLGILPSDYVDRGDGLLIGLDSFTALNRTVVLPKSSPPDPKWEFPRNRLTIEQVLGEGEFGRVLRAKAIDIGGWPGPTTVAVKTLKEDACASELADLLSEYQLLKEAQHPNVIRLLGACTSAGGPIYLIIEFAEFGSLRNYLRRSRHLESEGSAVPCSTSLLSASPNNSREQQGQQMIDVPSNCNITPRDILSFAWQISKGMAYLADIKLVHRDLAARNVLLASGKVCKISDFGLTRDVYEDDAYLKRSKGRVPVKWMAPESLADHVYTSKSDVWSFGVLLWELVTLGASPYPGVDVHNLYNLLKAGYRMEQPANCSQQLYKLMVSCWHEEPGMRPSFKELTNHWERMLEDGVEYLDLNPRTVHNQAYFASLHALDSPTNSSSGGKTFPGVLTTDAVNYLSKPLPEPVSKCDKIDKLHTLWNEPIASFPKEEPAKASYVNERLSNQAPDASSNHYESPIKLRRGQSSNGSTDDNDFVRSEEEFHDRPQSYIDMEGKKSKETDDLLLFGNDRRDDHDDEDEDDEGNEGLK